jgi:DNA-binding CsgD family transcriptional regulator
VIPIGTVDTTPALTAATGGATASTLALIVVDDDRNCLETNLAACRIVGRSREELLEGRLDDILAGSMRERLDNVWRAFVESGGHAGPFELAARGEAAGSVDINVTSEVLPGRHLLILTRSDDPQGTVEAGRPAAVSAPRNEPRRSRRGAETTGRMPTAREREILALLASGSTDGQIAEVLDLSPATVQTHVRNAKAKLGARTRAQAVAMALQGGLISTE